MYKSQQVANIIKNIAKEKNISVSKLLVDCELNKNALYTMQNRGTMPNADTLIKIADYFKCSIDYLVGRVDTPTACYVPHNMPKEIKKTIMLPFYLTPASAGTGSYVDGDTPVEYINIIKTDTSTSADYIIRVSGDSMEPMFFDGDKLLIEKSDSINDGTIGVFVLNGETYVKKIHQSTLVSLNPKYSPIQLNEYDECRCLGVVLGIADVLYLK